MGHYLINQRLTPTAPWGTPRAGGAHIEKDYYNENRNKFDK